MLMGMTSSKSSASPSTDTSKSEAERFYNCCGTLKQPAKMIIAPSILRKLLYLCSPLILTVRIKRNMIVKKNMKVKASMQFLTPSTRTLEVEKT